MFRQIILVLALLCAVVSVSSMAAPAKKPVAKKPVAKAAPSAGKKTSFIPEGVKIPKVGAWGGRPDPTPEMQKPEESGFFNAAWRYGRK